MGTRKLETRLTARLAALTGGVVVAVACAAVGLAKSRIDASDTDAARGQAESALDGIVMELDEGDTFAIGTGEVLAAARVAGFHVKITADGETAGDIDLPAIAGGACATLTREHGATWRACGAANARAQVVAALSIAPHRAAIVELAEALTAMVVVTLMLTAFAVRRALRGPLSELDALVEWTASIVATEASSPAPPSSTSEIARLQSAFGALVRQLLEALDRERASSAHIAHELRTPLTAIVADLDRAHGADAASQEALARVRSDAMRLAEVIEAILLLSERTGGERRGGAFVNVADVLREAAPAGARVEAPDEALVDGDERLVRLAVRNLVENARKHGGGARLLRLSRAGEGVRIAVIDGGPGLDAASRARMFDRYWRGRADTDGRGLGLALVRTVAERHGGRASAESGEGGRGLEVSLTLAGLAEWHEGDGTARAPT